ncbi:MAG: hypothetical protein IK024_04440 [Treponema sp.]|nr:hypothetical protein [Treponema sp.]
MKKAFVFLLIPFVFFGCGLGIIDYQLINKTDYDVILIDNSDYDKTEYEVTANSTRNIRRYNTGHFSIKNCTYPITISNGFSSSVIDYLPKYELKINNTTNKTYKLTITNDFQGDYTITSNQTTSLSIYKPSVKVNDLHIFFNDTEINNFILQNNTIIIVE